MGGFIALLTKVSSCFRCIYVLVEMFRTFKLIATHVLTLNQHTFTKGEQVVCRGLHRYLLARPCLYLPYLLPVCLSPSLYLPPLLTPPRPPPPPPACAGLKRSRRRCSFVPCHYILVLTRRRYEVPRRTWLIRRSTNTANYSLMPLSESQFSQRHSPNATKDRRTPRLPPIIADWIQTNEDYLNCSQSINHLSAHITLAFISAALRTLIVMTWQRSGRDMEWVKPSRRIMGVCLHVSPAPGVVCNQTQRGDVNRSG